MGGGKFKSCLPGEAEAGRDIPLSSRAIGRQADPPYTTTAPGRGGHSQMGCAVTMAEAERERKKVFTEMTADWPAASEGPLRGLRVSEGTGFLTNTDMPR